MLGKTHVLALFFGLGFVLGFASGNRKIYNSSPPAAQQHAGSTRPAAAGGSARGWGRSRRSAANQQQQKQHARIRPAAGQDQHKLPQARSCTAEGQRQASSTPAALHPGQQQQARIRPAAAGQQQQLQQQPRQVPPGGGDGWPGARINKKKTLPWPG